ncbi:MAG: DNA-protecting protein DprA [Deltaproteobacteria bacterium]|nr:DNA-protecting protein DprA [Deltaproteobacteria bacterium]
MSSKSHLSRTDRKNAFFWLALSRVPGVGNVIYNRLIEKFHAPENVFQSAPDELKKVEGIRPKTIAAISNFKGNDWVKRELGQIEKLGITLLTLNDDLYPRILKAIYDPPPILYIKGELQEKDSLSLAIVGSRSASAYGKDITRRLARSLTQRGFTIVSGLARGIDTAAHKGALKAGGRTLAVLGSGIDVIYPRENNTLAENIAQNGAIISEFPFGTPPEAAHFPSRNRIISGLSLGTVIIEASFRSGSLITARLALEQGREVFAVPGNVDSPWSKGTNRLIKEGAKLIMDPEDIIEEVLPQYERSGRSEDRKPSEPIELTPESQKILDLIEANPVHIDTLIQKSGLPSGQVSSLLLDLELKSLVQQLSGKMFKKLLNAG